MTAGEPTDRFRTLLRDPAPPQDARPALRALWHAGRGEWALAHATVQDETDPESAWVHAHLHRQEGDLANAAYWYRRAARPEARGTIQDEWAAIAAALLRP